MLLAEIQDAIAKSQINGHFWMAKQKIIHNRGNMASTKQHGSADGQISPQLRFARDERFFGLVCGGQDDATAFKVQCALLGEPDSTRGAMKQLYPEMALQ